MQVETLPQSMVDVKTIVLKPRLDRNDVRLIGENLKPQLFSKFGFKHKPENTKLLASEQYFEPYLIIGGKYVLDYCKKHVMEAEVDKKTNKVFIAGQEFNSKEADPKTKRRVLELAGEEYVHYEKQGYYILDRIKREVPPEKLPLSAFVLIEKNSELDYSFKRIHLSDEAQIDFLRSKIAQRPTDVAEIIKEIFDITDRTIANYPMYLLTFENAKKQKEQTVTVDGITGETVLNGASTLTSKTTHDSQETLESQIWEPRVRIAQTEKKTTPTPDIAPTIGKDEKEVSLRDDHIFEPQISHPAIFKEDLAETSHEPLIPASKYVNEASLKEDRVTTTTAPTNPTVCDEVRPKPVPEDIPDVTKNKLTEPKLAEQIVPENAKPEKQIKPIPDIVQSASKDEVSDSPNERKIIESPPQPVVRWEDQADAAVKAIARALAVLKATEPTASEEVHVKPVRNVVPSLADTNSESSQKGDEKVDTKLTEPIAREEVQAKAVPSLAKHDIEHAPKDSQIVQQGELEKATSFEREQGEPILHILTPGATDDTLAVSKEENNRPIQSDEYNPTNLGLPARNIGDEAEIDDNITTVDGDLEIPSGTHINKNFVVKGSLRIGNNCRGHGKLRASEDITIGSDTIIDGDLISGGNIFVGPRSMINGTVEASGVFEIEKDAVVEVVCAKTSTIQSHPIV